MRLQKHLAHAGFGARRKCELLIAAGRVTINGRRATLGENVQPGDAVAVDGKPVTRAEAKVYIALNKPVGYTSDRSDPRNKSMFELVDVPERLFGVGRLDKDSSGLILLTNDGEFAYRLTHPRFEHEKEYRAVVAGRPDPRALQRWRDGVMLDGETTKTAPCRVDIVRTAPGAPRQSGQDATVLRIIMHEGRKRQIRRVAKLLGHRVIELARVRVGSIGLGALESGSWRRLTEREVRALLSAPNTSRRG
jgi:23S rRNA pseudouridine2605 synthase